MIVYYNFVCVYEKLEIIYVLYKEKWINKWYIFLTEYLVEVKMNE